MSISGSHVPAFDWETYKKMQKVRQDLDRQYQIIEHKRMHVEKALCWMQELRKPQNVFMNKQKEQVIKKLSNAQRDFDYALAEFD
jgi:hypothetical protein